jgi:hypothetical protein
MASLGSTMCRGQSGKKYRFQVYALGSRLRKTSGVYVVTTRVSNGEGGHRHVPLYVGQCDDLSKPIDKHRKVAMLRENGANCICVQVDVAADSRLAKKQDLIAAFHPVCNG